MILIVGAGLSGLLTAYRLQKEGIPFKILEARNRVGGRINTIYGTDQATVEMGATWFNKQHQSLISLLEELNIEYFEQFMDSNVFYQPSSTSAAELVQIPSEVASYRISGGSSHLINALFNQLDKKDILVNQSVKQITFRETSILVQAEKTFEGNSVVLAIPPKLWAKKISFEPPLATDLMRIAIQTQTWMEDSIKVALTYNQPFWEQENLPATLFSNVGPIAELYDHCDHKRSKYAVCGFINPTFKQLSSAERQEAVIKQLKNVFGPGAEKFTRYEECLWSKEENTFEASEALLYPHQNNGNPIFRQSFWGTKLLISGSESASAFPGYMEGAVLSANLTVKRIKLAE